MTSEHPAAEERVSSLIRRCRQLGGIDRLGRLALEDGAAAYEERERGEPEETTVFPSNRGCDGDWHDGDGGKNHTVG